MASAEHEKLKEMAQGAGLRLVKSRKRKPGVGDYGRYGLATLEGQPCFGIAEDGTLTATPEELETYLRRREKPLKAVGVDGKGHQACTAEAARNVKRSR